jgi:hypothetical protein
LVCRETPRRSSRRRDDGVESGGNDGRFIADCPRLLHVQKTPVRRSHERTSETFNEGVMERLTMAVGRTAGERYAKEALTTLGMREVSTPDDLLAFANYL